MSLKGKLFTAADVSASHARKLARNAERKGQKDAGAEIAAWCAAQTERYKVVAIDPSEPPARQAIIAEELDQRAVNKLSAPARRIAGMLLRLPLAVRAEMLAAFEPNGRLKHPFKMV